MAKDRLDEKVDMVLATGAASTLLSAERAQLEASGRNWEARHVADMLGWTELTVLRKARSGQLPSVKIGRERQFPPARVRAWYAGELHPTESRRGRKP